MARPPKYKTADELQEKVDEYFDNNGIERIKQTITGLCLYLGFCSRQSMYDLEKQEKFSYTIKRARLRIEKHYESMLQGNSVAGPIFALKNLGWQDTQSIDHTSKGEKITPVNITVNNDEQRDKLSGIGAAVNEDD